MGIAAFSRLLVRVRLKPDTAEETTDIPVVSASGEPAECFNQWREVEGYA
jgi:hypothetical protein